MKDFSLNTSPSAPSFFLSSSPNNTDSLEPIFFADAFNQPLLEAVSLELHAQNKNLFLEEGSLRTTRGVSSERKKGEKSNNPQPSSSQPSSLSTSVPTPTNAAQAAGDIQGENNAKNEYLTDQLEKHQKENLAKKKRLEKKRKQKKRVRSQSRQSYPNSRNALKDTFQMYMDDISREDLLSQAEVNVLARRIKLGSIVENLQCSMESSLGRRASIPELADKLKISTSAVQKQIMAGTAAKNSLVAANLRLVTSVARKMALSKGTNTVGIALDDMIQEGSVGLIRAAEKFDAGRGYKFSTYATWWVRAYIMRSISTQSRSIKVPGTIIEEYSRIQKEYSKHSAAGNFKPDDLVIARGLGITQAKLRFILQVVTQVPTSLDIKLGHGEDAANSRSLVEVVEGSDKIEERMVKDFEKKELDSALRDCLDSVERAVIRVRFGLDDGQPRSLRETGDLLGLSKERIRQIVFRALPKMKTPKMQKMLTNVMSD